MPTPFGGEARDLSFPLDRQVSLSATTNDDEPCGIPTFPSDPDEKATILFRLSLNDYVALASCVDVGSDIAYGAEAIKLWWLWSTSVMCAAFCEEIALCLMTENEAVINALATALKSNPTLLQALADATSSNGSGTPGKPLSESLANSDTLPPNVKDEEGACIYDALWGGCLFLVQSGNRLITDFFEKLESASNTLETSAIVAETVPAAGPYVSAAAQFADQLQENLAEGYAAAYTEEYEEQLACTLFCLARSGCELTPDMLVNALGDRLGYTSGTENFGVLMARVGTNVFVGQGIADAMFYIYFSALRFGQQFLDQIGVRPMTDLMGLGADQLASDNWATLCDCPEVCTAPDFRVVNPVGFAGGSFEVTDNMDGTWTVVFSSAFDTNANRCAIVEVNTGCCWNVVSVDYSATPENLNAQYNCGANPDDTDYDNGIGTGPLTVGLCGAGVIASSVSTAFTVTAVLEACP